MSSCARGFTCHRVATGEEALAFARKQRPAAVVLDVILPGTTGYEICRELRETYGEHLPIVFMSGDRVEAPDRVVGLLLGADDYLVKPIDPDELTARLRRLITRAATEKRNQAGAPTRSPSSRPARARSCGCSRAA